MYYTIYKIVNQIDGKIYIGSHKTKDLNDNYMGSGKYLKRAQEKYGLNNFTKEILFVYDNPEEMYAKEGEIVNEDFLATKNTYNLKKGGFGGWDHIKTTPFRGRNFQKEMSKRGNNKKKLLLLNENYRKQICLKISKVKKTQYENGLTNPFAGKKHTLEHKQKMSSVMKEKQSGDKNSQFGSMWITDGTKNKKIKKDDFIPKGWNKGRIKVE